jgi:uncharacterized protein YukE
MTDHGEFQVHSASLVAHATEVDRIADGLTTAAQAGEAVRTDPGAYGQLGQMIPDLLNGLQQIMIDGMTTAAGCLHDTADSLRSVAAAYETADGNAAGRLQGPR